MFTAHSRISVLVAQIGPELCPVSVAATAASQTEGHLLKIEIAQSTAKKDECNALPPFQHDQDQSKLASYFNYHDSLAQHNGWWVHNTLHCCQQVQLSVSGSQDRVTC